MGCREGTKPQILVIDEDLNRTGIVGGLIR
jgi:hypothetical protein